MAATVCWRLAAILVSYLSSVITQKPIGPDACQFAFMVDGTGRAAVDGDCTRFVQCDFSETAETSAHIVDCPDGLFWNPATLVCQYPEDVECQFDPCVGNSNGTYQLLTDNCGEYWSCFGERTFQKLCCDFRESYSPGQGCVPDVACETPCPREFVPQNLTGCGIVQHPTDNRNYIQLSEDGRSFDMRCALGGLYDPETCDCSIHDEDWVPFDPPNCVPSFSLSFPPENTFRDFSGYDSDVVNFRAKLDTAMQDTPSGDRGAVFFDGVSNKIVSRRFNFAEFGYTPKFNITFREDNPDGRTGNVALLTNKACDMPSSIELYLMPETATIRGQLLTEVGPISVEAPYQRSQWNSVLMAYNGEQLSISVNGIFRATPPTGNPAKVVPMQCSLQIGFGQAMNNFRGHIDEISITLC